MPSSSYSALVTAQVWNSGLAAMRDAPFQAATIGLNKTNIDNDLQMLVTYEDDEEAGSPHGEQSSS